MENGNEYDPDTQIIVFDHKTGDELFTYYSFWAPGTNDLLSRGIDRYKVKKVCFHVNNHRLVHLSVKEL